MLPPLHWTPNNLSIDWVEEDLSPQKFPATSQSVPQLGTRSGDPHRNASDSCRHLQTYPEYHQRTWHETANRTSLPVWSMVGRCWALLWLANSSMFLSALQGEVPSFVFMQLVHHVAPGSTAKEGSAKKTKKRSNSLPPCIHDPAQAYISMRGRPPPTPPPTRQKKNNNFAFNYTSTVEQTCTRSILIKGYPNDKAKK